MEISFAPLLETLEDSDADSHLSSFDDNVEPLLVEYSRSVLDIQDEFTTIDVE